MGDSYFLRSRSSGRFPLNKSYAKLPNKYANLSVSKVRVKSTCKFYTFVHARSENRLPKSFLSRLGLLQRRPDLVANGRYTITSDVSREVVDLFFARVLGDDSEVVTEENAEELQALSEELGFTGFDNEIHAYLDSDLKVRRDLASLHRRVDRYEVVIEQLQRRVLELERLLQAQRGVERTRNDVADASFPE